MEYYKRTSVEESLKVSNLISFHYFEYIREFEGILEKHNFSELVYIDYGNVKLISGETEYSLSPGEGFIHAPDEWHNIVSTGDFASAFIISFDCDCRELSNIMSRKLKFNGDQAKLISRLYDTGRKVFEAPYDIFNQQKLKIREDAPFGGIQAVKNLLELLLLNLIESENVTKTVPESHDVMDSDNESIIVDKVIELIAENLYEKISLDEICSRLSFSKSYILRIFKKHVGCSVMDYYNQMKIKEAKRLISKGQYTYTEIARLLNYSSVHHFSRNFKLVTNMTPSGYQRSLKNKSVI